MSKEYNLAGKQLVVDGITILGNRKKQRSSILTQAITNGELARDNALTGEQVEALGGTVILISEDLGETKGRVTTNENNISGLDGRMDTAEGNISSQGGRITTAEGNISGLQGRMTAAEGGISGLQQVTKRFDVRSLQTTIVRDDTAKGSQEIVLQSTIIGYEDPQPRLAIMTSFTIERICAMEADPSTLIDESDIGSSITPTPSGEGSWYRGGLLFQVGDSAAFIQYSGAVYQTVVLTVTAVGDSSITGTVAEIVPAARGIDDRDMTNVAIYIPYRYAGKIEASLYNGNTLMDSLTIPVTDQTRSWKQLSTVYDNKAELDAVKEDEEGYLVDGDCAVVRYEYNSSTQQYDDFQLNTYILKAGTWTKAEDSDAKQIIETIYTYLGEASEYKKTHPDFNYEDTASASKAIFGKLMAGIIYAGEIFANDIISTEYEPHPGSDYPTKGFRMSTKENLIEAVKAVFSEAKIKDSSLEDVTIKITDGATQTKLLESTMGIVPPSTHPTFDNESAATLVESNRSSYSWSNSLLSHINQNIKKNPSASGSNLTMEFDVQNDVQVYFRAPYANFAVISGSLGTMTLTVTVDGSVVYTQTGQEANEAIGTIKALHKGEHVVFSVTYNHGNAYGIKGFTYSSKLYIIGFLDRYKNSWNYGGSQSDGWRLDAYVIPGTATKTVGSTTSTDTIYFPVMAYADTYTASVMVSRNILVDGVSATSRASLLPSGLSASSYKAITPLLDAKGTQGGNLVQAIPRNVWIGITSTTVKYKRDSFTVNQLYLSETYATFAYNGQIAFNSITDEEYSSVAYDITLIAISPSLTVGTLLPSQTGVTDIGLAGFEFDELHVLHAHATDMKVSSISAPTGGNLDISARDGSFSGDVDADIITATTRIDGNVNSSGTTKKVYGAVFN